MRSLTHLVLGLSLVSLGGCAEQPGKKKEEKTETKTESKTVDGKEVTKAVSETKTVEGEKK